MQSVYKAESCEMEEGKRCLLLTLISRLSSFTTFT